MKKKLSILAAAVALLSLTACQPEPDVTSVSSEQQSVAIKPTMKLAEGFDPQRFDIYAPFRLTTDLSSFSEQQKKMLSLLIDAADIMNNLFWEQANGATKAEVMRGIKNADLQHFITVNYGPWDRLDGDHPVIVGVGEKPLGAGFYPVDMTKDEFKNALFADKTGLYSMVVRDDQGALTSIPYSVYFHDDLAHAASLLRQAAQLADDQDFAKYLRLRADALLNDDYFASDMAWMDMKNNPIDIVIGPIETYEDQLFGYRASFEAYVLVKDQQWSAKLARFAQFLPGLQQNLPVDDKYKQEVPGSDADLNAYDVIYYAGNANAGGKTIAINLPNDEKVQLQKGTRRLQLKNAMRAKFDKIMVPISEQLIAEDQRKHVTFNAFFANTMFHEVAHGLGIKNTIDGKGTVRHALKEYASALEEGKADILGLYMVRELLHRGEITEGTLEDYYTTFMAGIFRSVRFGATEAHGQANMIRFNFFKEQGAFSRDEDGLYRVNYPAMTKAINALSAKILTLQGNGDYSGVAKLVADYAKIGPLLAKDLQRLDAASIPVDVEFIQGKSVLGLPE